MVGRQHGQEDGPRGSDAVGHDRSVQEENESHSGDQDEMVGDSWGWSGKTRVTWSWCVGGRVL